MNSCWRSLFGLIFLMGLAEFSNGQQLGVDSPPLLDEYPYFKSSFIKKKQIKSIITEVMYKVPNRKIKHSMESKTFEFDRLGRVKRLIEVNILRSRATTSFYFDNRGSLITEHFVDPKKNELKSFLYNEDGRIIKKKISNGETATLISTENYKYESFSAIQFKRYYLNDEGLTYKYEVVDLNKDGQVIESRLRYIRGVHREFTKNTFENGTLIAHSFNKKTTTRREIKYELNYDEKSMLQTTNSWVDAAPLFHYEYLYENGVIIAILRKDLQTKEIQITKLKYAYY